MRKLLNYGSKPNYASPKIFNENLVAVHKIKDMWDIRYILIRYIYDILYIRYVGCVFLILVKH